MKALYIQVQDSFEGFHHWPEAEGVVSFLRAIHWHHFKYTLRIEGQDLTSRALEFHLLRDVLKKDILPYMTKHFAKEKPAIQFSRSLGYFLGSASCEQMAEYLLDKVFTYLEHAHVPVTKLDVLVEEDQLQGGGCTWTLQ